MAISRHDLLRIAVATPTFFIGTRGEGGRVRLLGKINGAQPYRLFREALSRFVDVR